MSKKNKTLQKIIQLVDKAAPDAEVYLYGSRAKGLAKTHSDWDLLILLNQSEVSFKAETKFMDDFYELELETGEVISPLIYPKNEWYSKHVATPLFENIHKEGVKLK